MKYTKKQFLLEVAKEAKALKKVATTAQLKRLNFFSLNPQNLNTCIYGQMTGDCRSKKAAELITACCIRYFSMPSSHEGFNVDKKGMQVISKCVNGKQVEGFVKERVQRFTIHHFSAIETYIMLPNAKNKNLIAYLKDERKDLVL